MKYIKQKAFTLVELIVVVTILAILATIGFVSYSSYLTWVRDTNRLAQIVSIHDWLVLYSTKKDLPLPDESIEISVSWNLIAYQWIAWSNVLEIIDFTKWGQDPRDWQFFTYYLTNDRKYFQLLWFLEEDQNLSNNIMLNNTYAIDYTNRIPTVYGRKLGVLTNTENQPIEQLWDNIDIISTTIWFKAHISENEILETIELVQIAPNSSCKRVRQSRSWAVNWIYKLSNDWGTTLFNSYCYMENLKEDLIAERMGIGTGNQWKYEYRARIGESERLLWKTPFWFTDVLWKSISDGDVWDRNEGWFEYELWESLDKTKTYRFSVWVKKTWSAIWEVYFWTKWNIVQRLDATSADSNPYFIRIEPVPQINEWYLYVWYIHIKGYTWDDQEWWVYTYGNWLQKLENGSSSYWIHRDFEHSSIEWLNTNLRIFWYDNFNTSDEYYFYNPKIEIIEPRQVGDVSDLAP